MPMYTYLLQILPKGSENWANLLEPRTGALLDGTFGVVQVGDEGLSHAAREIMGPFAGMGLRRRVAFWEGRRVNEKLYGSEVFRMVFDDGEIADADSIARDYSDGPARQSENVRPGCPHAPHDGSCGHEDLCMFAHHGRDCEAVRPVCPACLEEERPATVRNIVSQVRRDGELLLRCSSCERLSFQFDVQLVCDTCQWLVPHVNEELEERFAASGGRFSPEPGSCPGCGHQMPRPPGPLSFGCPKCGRSVTVSLESLKPGSTVSTMCPDRECGHFITIPPSIWCQQCGQRLRPLPVITKLILEANDVRLAARSNVREDETTRLARRLAEAAESSTRRWAYLTGEQQGLIWNMSYLDSLAFSGESPEWIRDIVEIRVAGHELNRKGGMRAMREVHQRVMELGRGYRSAARLIEAYWDKIGAWEA
jgi:hypothetical protein